LWGCAFSGSIPACTIIKAYLFNRYNGNQLLFVLNLYASLTEGFTVSMGLKIEDRLMNQLPVDAKSEISVLNWLKQIPPLPVSNAF